MKKLVTILSVLLFSICCIGQTTMSFHYVHAVPMGKYEQNLMHQPSGIAFEYMKGIDKIKNLQIGGSFNVSMYQNEDYEGQVNLSEPGSTYIETNEDDCYYIYQGIARYSITPEKAFLRPYIQGQVGGTTYFSTLSVMENSGSDLSGRTQNHGTTWLVGFAGGMQIRLFEGAAIDLSVGYNDSGNVEYRSSPDLQNSAQYRVDLRSHLQESKVKHLSLKLGIAMVF